MRVDCDEGEGWSLGFLLVDPPISKLLHFIAYIDNKQNKDQLAINQKYSLQTYYGWLLNLIQTLK